jgi:hypothetical protein
LISTWLENLRWTASLWIGVGLCLVGNVLVLARRHSPGDEGIAKNRP